jgi:hypothetical protein
VHAHATLLARKVLPDSMYRGVMKAFFSLSSVSVLQRVAGVLQKARA